MDGVFAVNGTAAVAVSCKRALRNVTPDCMTAIPISNLTQVVHSTVLLIRPLPPPSTSVPCSLNGGVLLVAITQLC